MFFFSLYTRFFLFQAEELARLKTEKQEELKSIISEVFSDFDELETTSKVHTYMVKPWFGPSQLGCLGSLVGRASVWSTVCRGFESHLRQLSFFHFSIFPLHMFIYTCTCISTCTCTHTCISPQPPSQFTMYMYCTM